MERYYIICQGQVQGVGFRTYVNLKALEYNLTGSVKNLDNGMVEIQLQGIEADIFSCLKIIREGNMFIQVTDYSIKKIPIIPNEKKFRVNYY